MREIVFLNLRRKVQEVHKADIRGLCIVLFLKYEVQIYLQVSVISEMRY